MDEFEREPENLRPNSLARSAAFVAKVAIVCFAVWCAWLIGSLKPPVFIDRVNVIERTVEVPVDVIREVPGPERVVDRVVEVPVEVVREVRVDVPGPERIVEVEKRVEVPVYITLPKPKPVAKKRRPKPHAPRCSR